jgi:hypothetical protein
MPGMGDTAIYPVTRAIASGVSASMPRFPRLRRTRRRPALRAPARTLAVALAATLAVASACTDGALPLGFLRDALVARIEAVPGAIEIRNPGSLPLGYAAWGNGLLVSLAPECLACPVVQPRGVTLIPLASIPGIEADSLVRVTLFFIGSGPVDEPTTHRVREEIIRVRGP